MSPGLHASRPCWVWSISAFAIILSLWWYRKNRGSLKTDSGGTGETRDERKSVESDEKSFVKSETVDGVSLANGDILKFDSEKREVVAEVKIAQVVSAEREIVEEKVCDVEREARSNGDLKKADFRGGDDNNNHSHSEDNRSNEEEEEEEKKEEKEEGTDKGIEKNFDAEDEEEEEEIVRAIENSMLIPEQEIDEKPLWADESKEIEETDAELNQTETNKEPTASFAQGKRVKKENMKHSPGKMANETGVDANVSSGDKDKDKDDTVCMLEKKLAKLELCGSQCKDQDGIEKENSDDVTERDSANNSPSEVMLASPSVGGYSDTHSEGSSDSGKGCSEMLTPSRTPASGNSVFGDLPVTSIYEFVIPQQLVGRLIGRHGSYLNEIKVATNASIYIKRHPETSKLKICAIEGTQMDIESALDMIRQKFPKKRYPNVTLEQVVTAPEPQLIPIIPENMQLYLVESINNDVLLSSLVTAGHFFLQQPTHPTYLSLSRLNSCMNLCYSEPNQPTLPEGVGAGILCAAPVQDGWYRAQITSMDPETKICDVKFVDYGGYMTMPVSMLRQMRFDFVNLPFQAAECYLANVKPANEDNVWCESARKVVEKLTFGKVLQAQVYGYAEDGVPLIHLYTVINGEVVLINERLVDLGLAEWIYPETEEEEVVECEIRDEPAAVAV